MSVLAKLPWRRLVRGVLAGFVGTSTMTATAWLYDRWHRNGQPVGEGPVPVVDFDNSDHVVIAAATVLHVEPRTPAQRRALFLLVHWGYGSAVGVVHSGLRQLLPNRWLATAAFFAFGQTMAMSLFPVFGRTPPPWRWTRQQQVVSVVQHAIYALAVDAADTDR